MSDAALHPAEKLFKVHVEYRWREDDTDRGLNEAARLFHRAKSLLREWGAADHFVNAYLNEQDDLQGVMVLVLRDRNAALLLKLALA